MSMHSAARTRRARVTMHQGSACPWGWESVSGTSGMYMTPLVVQRGKVCQGEGKRGEYVKENFVKHESPCVMACQAIRFKWLNV